jgi:hypothetical protein
MLINDSALPKASLPSPTLPNPSLNDPQLSNFPQPVSRADLPRPEVSDNIGVAPTNPEQSKPVPEDVVSIGKEKDKPSTYESLADIAKKQKADDKSLEEQEKADAAKIQELKDRDQEVRTHEQAHAAVGGQYAGAPSYEFETGPDGNRYAVGGEVSIDVSEEKDPEDTVSKMQVVRAAALAPAEPSTQDYKVAAEAAQKEQAARADIAKKSATGGESSAKDASSSDANSIEAEPFNMQANIMALRQYQLSSMPAMKAFSAQA